jgi:hypothetical protein
MRAATPAVTQYVELPAAAPQAAFGGDAMTASPRRSRARGERPQRQLLDQPAAGDADAALALEAAGGDGRPRLRGAARPRVYVQIVDAPFFLKQGEIRYGHTLELAASRGRIVDRNGLILAASIPAPRSGRSRRTSKATPPAAPGSPACST